MTKLAATGCFMAMMMTVSWFGDVSTTTTTTTTETTTTPTTTTTSVTTTTQPAPDVTTTGEASGAGVTTAASGGASPASSGSSAAPAESPAPNNADATTAGSQGSGSSNSNVTTEPGESQATEASGGSSGNEEPQQGGSGGSGGSGSSGGSGGSGGFGKDEQTEAPRKSDTASNSSETYTPLRCHVYTEGAGCQPDDVNCTSTPVEETIKSTCINSYGICYVTFNKRNKTMTLGCKDKHSTDSKSCVSEFAGVYAESSCQFCCSSEDYCNTGKTYEEIQAECELLARAGTEHIQASLIPILLSSVVLLQLTR